eukprot:4250610-Pyramimonas_sp.AAC.1
MTRLAHRSASATEGVALAAPSSEHLPDRQMHQPGGPAAGGGKQRPSELKAGPLSARPTEPPQSCWGWP